MSWNLVPLPGPLLSEKRVKAEATLGCVSTLPVEKKPPTDHLYKWADDIWNKLTADGHSNPKLMIAESLDIPVEIRWLGCVSTQRNTPRHRVVARFARECLWHEIWSLNWDCVQESALENVGIKRSAIDGYMPWPTVFNTFVTAADCAQCGESNSIRIMKPHGCVMALVQAQEARAKGNAALAVSLSERFLITQTELNRLDPAVVSAPAQQFIFATLLNSLCSHPFVVAGWSASERYLIDHINTGVRPVLQDSNRQTPIATDELSVIDIQFNAEGHTSLAGFYGKTAGAAYIDVGQPGFGTDDLFLWLQAVYALDCLRARAVSGDVRTLDSLIVEIQQPPNKPTFVISWVDNFLPVWVRLCWRNGLVACEDKNAKSVEIDDVALESRDEHIPWALPNIKRPELIAASRLLAALQRSGHAIDWNYEQFPGGLYRDFRLVIPIPIWTGDPPNDLRGLKALIDAIKQNSPGYLEKIELVFVGLDSAHVIPDGTKKVWKQLVARDLSMARFAKADDIGAIQLEDL